MSSKTLDKTGARRKVSPINNFADGPPCTTKNDLFWLYNINRSTA